MLSNGTIGADDFVASRHASLDADPRTSFESRRTMKSDVNIHTDKILILDFGAQYTQLIARRVREIGVYCEIWAWDHDPAEIAKFAPRGIILSGGPESTTERDAPRAPHEVFDLGAPLLGICYGMQTMAMQLGGTVEGGHAREFGYAAVKPTAENRLLEGLAGERGLLDVWMSHGDRVTAVPPGYVVVGSTETVPIAAMANEAERRYGVQFHPEVTHTKQGTEILRRFVVDICGCATLWTPVRHHRGRDRARARAGRQGQGAARSFRRRRFIGRRRAARERDRRSAHLRVRRYRPAALARRRSGHGDDGRAHGRARHPRRRGRAFLLRR